MQDDLVERIGWIVDGAIDSLDGEIERATELLNSVDSSNKKENRTIILQQFEAELLQKWRMIRKELDTPSKVG